MSWIDIILMTAFVGFSVGFCDSNINKIFVGIISVIGCAIMIAAKYGYIG